MSKSFRSNRWLAERKTVCDVVTVLVQTAPVKVCS